MERKNASLNSSSFQQIDFDLPDDCWESIFKFIINDDDEDYKNCHYLNSLSLVSKHFLSITNRLRFSLNVFNKSLMGSFFKKFTNLNSLKLGYSIDSNYVLSKISDFPLKITSLKLLYQRTIPAIGLRTFSQKITTLTSLTCSNIESLSSSDLLLIAECFPLLEELDLSEPENYVTNADGLKALSLCKLRKINITKFPINNQSLFHLFKNCKNLEEVIMFRCSEISNVGIASALRERTTLRSLSFSTTENPDSTPFLATSHFIDSLVSLKGLTCLVLNCTKISDELLYSIARECLPLTRFNIESCTGHSYLGIYCLLSKCQHVQHLDLQCNHFLTDQHVVELSSFLGDLVSINLSYSYKLTESALFALTRNCLSLSEIKMERIWSDIVANSDSLGEFGVYPQLKSLYLGYNSWLSDETIIMFASNFSNLQLLDLNGCNCISEGISQVLRRCCKIKHLNLANCSKVKLIGVNFVAPKLEVLNLSNTNVDDETLYVISKKCSGLLWLSFQCCNGVTEKGLKHMVENCTQLRTIIVQGIHISDKHKEFFKLHGCNVFSYYGDI